MHYCNLIASITFHKMTMMRNIAVQAYRTFSQISGSSEVLFQQNLSKLSDIVGHLTTRDLKFDDSLINGRPTNISEAPVTYIDIWKDEFFSMSVFVLKPGSRLPLHDHPDMHGLIRVLHGNVGVRSYSVLTETKADESLSSSRGKHFKVGHILAAKLQVCSRVDASSRPLLLTPTVGNVHEIQANDEPAVLFDLLAPPYDEHDLAGEHPCHYFQDISLSSPKHAMMSTQDIRHLVCTPPPSDYWTDYAPYKGPTFDPYDSTVII